MVKICTEQDLPVPVVKLYNTVDSGSKPFRHLIRVASHPRRGKQEFALSKGFSLRRGSAKGGGEVLYP